MEELDGAYQNFLDKKDFLLKYNSSDISESDTRSKIIDCIFKEILGWTEDDIERERYVKVGYYDYELITSTFRFVIEAKKTNIDFSLPQKGKTIKLKTLYEGNKNVINQIRGYLFERSLLYGVITNGRQFIISKFVNTDGTDWLDNTAVIYQDLNVVQENFIQFYELLSKQSVADLGRLKLISDQSIGKTILTSGNLKRKNDELIRNKESQELIPIITSVFEEIYQTEDLEDGKLLDECYIKNEDVKKYNSELGFIFTDTPPSYDGRINPVQNTERTQNVLKEEINSENRLPDPIIIIGGKGSGKTTFINYFIKVTLDKSTQRNRPIVYLDFRKETESTIKNTKAIYRKILSQLLEEHRSLNLSYFNILKTIYKDDIEHQQKGFWQYITDEAELDKKRSEYIENVSQDPIIHLTKVSLYLIQKCRKRLCVIIDNADQLDESVQREVFILAQSLHRNLSSIIVLSLREGYFYKYKNQPPFDAYHSTILHITAPPYREVLKTRINYVLKNYKFPTVSIRKDNISFELTQGSLTHLFKNLYSALFVRSNSEILSFLEETSYPNIRNGLEKFKFFLLSGHTKTNVYMSYDYGVEGKNSIPIWEFVKSVALESNYYYHSKTSQLFNIFYPSPSNRNHFTKIRILDYIIENNQGIGHKNKFILCSDIINTFIRAGYTKDIILEELNVLYQAGLIFTNNYSSDVDDEISLNEEHEIGVTQSGVYYIKTLITRFHYYDIIIQDTPIYDNDKFDQILKVFPECGQYGNRDLALRVESMKQFIDYLKTQEKIDHSKKEINYNVKSLNLKIMESLVKNSLDRDIRKIETYLAEL